jgi:hypothetical protein
VNTKDLKREATRAVRVTQIIRENLATVLSVLIAVGERDIAERLASVMGTALWAEFRTLKPAEIRAGGIQEGLAARARVARAQLPAVVDVEAPTADDLTACLFEMLRNGRTA